MEKASGSSTVGRRSFLAGGAAVAALATMGAAKGRAGDAAPDVAGRTHPVSRERIRLLDGRWLDVEVSGPRYGTPLVLHNSTPGSAFQFTRIRVAAHERGIRLVTFARPGYGESTRLPGRSVVDVARDVEAVLDRFDISRCLVLGWSGGGPHALATAARLPARVAAVASVSGFAPIDADGLDFFAGMGQGNIDEYSLALAGESELRPAIEPQAAGLLGSSVQEFQDGLASSMKPVDKAFMDEDNAGQLLSAVKPGLRHGPDGWIDDDLAFVKPWGFSVQDITVPAFVWQGGQDLLVPYAHGKWLSRRVPDATVRFEPDLGHFSLGMGRFAEILDALRTAW